MRRRAAQEQECKSDAEIDELPLPAIPYVRHQVLHSLLEADVSACRFVVEMSTDHDESRLSGRYVCLSRPLNTRCDRCDAELDRLNVIAIDVRPARPLFDPLVTHI